MTVADVVFQPEVPKHSITGMTLYLVQWFDAEPKWDASEFIIAPSAKAAKDVIWDMEDVGNPKRIKAIEITSEAQFREHCKPEHDHFAMIEDVRDYKHEDQDWNTLYCTTVESLLPLLREEWRLAENRAMENKWQLKLFTVRRKARA